MFRALVTVLLIFAVQSVSSYGDIECIKNYTDTESRGFTLIDCKESVELSFYTKKQREVMIGSFGRKSSDVNYKLIINDMCTLTFEGHYNKNKSYGIWKDSTGNTKRCNYSPWCALLLNNEGKLMNLVDGQEFGCVGKLLRNDVDNEWTWTKIRIEDISSNFTFGINVEGAEEGELRPYTGPNLNDLLSKVIWTIKDDGTNN
ncbi:hypothetical protein M3Y94_00023100 [Aphelenchoides besseyi]|nr:hypothetical protein M3Y94_00023100 [Aphelenchoides besseyi]KAI6217078.1 hypothetical protein M3Y95_01243400 [Aphelenchoides besseyi]